MTRFLLLLSLSSVKEMRPYVTVSRRANEGARAGALGREYPAGMKLLQFLRHEKPGIDLEKVIEEKLGHKLVQSYAELAGGWDE
jgi:hypothetical protein